MSYYPLPSQIKRFCIESPEWHYKSEFERRVWPKKNGSAFIAETVTRTLRSMVEQKILESDTDTKGYARYRIRGGQETVERLGKPRYETALVDGKVVVIDTHASL